MPCNASLGVGRLPATTSMRTTPQGVGSERIQALVGRAGDALRNGYAISIRSRVRFYQKGELVFRKSTI